MIYEAACMRQYVYIMYFLCIFDYYGRGWCVVGNVYMYTISNMMKYVVDMYKDEK